MNLKKAVSRKARKERKGKSGGYLILAFHLIGSGRYLHLSLNFFAPLAPLREQMPFLGWTSFAFLSLGSQRKKPPPFQVSGFFLLTGDLN
jgi:hypothetical protein